MTRVWGEALFKKRRTSTDRSVTTSVTAPRIVTRESRSTTCATNMRARCALQLAALACTLATGSAFHHGPMHSGGSLPLAVRAPLRRPAPGVRCAPVHRLTCQLDPSAVGAAAAVWDAAHLHCGAAAGSVLIALEDGPLAEVQEYILEHPLQDAGAIAVALFTLNALKAGATLPVAIVAGCLELLRRIPGFTMIGTKPLLKLAISVAIDFIGIRRPLGAARVARLRAGSHARAPCASAARRLIQRTRYCVLRAAAGGRGGRPWMGAGQRDSRSSLVRQQRECFSYAQGCKA
jgi:hypothetical protein